jgi:hypothetical protein
MTPVELIQKGFKSLIDTLDFNTVRLVAQVILFAPLHAPILGDFHKSASPKVGRAVSFSCFPKK